MTVHEMAPSIHDRRRGRAVASYTDARGAALAVAALEARGFAPGDVAVQPGQMSLDPSVLRRPKAAPEWLVPSVAALVALVVVFASLDGVGGAVLLALVAAFAASVVGRLLELAARRWSARRMDRAAATVAAGRFDVVVTVRDREAEHVLASWSDPGATPVHTERTAA